MKKLIFLLGMFLISGLCFSQTPRFGTLPSQDNTGRTFTYGYIKPATPSTPFTLSGTAFNYNQTWVDMTTVSGSTTLTGFKLGRGYLGDQISIVTYGGASPAIITLRNLTTTIAGYTTAPGFIYLAPLTVPSGKYGNMELIYQNGQYVEQGRFVSP